MGNPNDELMPDETELLLDRLAEMMDSLEWDWSVGTLNISFYAKRFNRALIA